MTGRELLVLLTACPEDTLDRPVAVEQVGGNDRPATGAAMTGPTHGILLLVRPR